MKEKRYCVTGLSRLTGTRKAITPPCSLRAARRALVIAGYSQNSESAYTRLRVDIWGPIQQEILFTD